MKADTGKPAGSPEGERPPRERRKLGLKYGAPLADGKRERG